jgi:hypothetical protein
LVKFNAFEEAKNEILAPSEPQIIVPPKQKQIPPKESVKLKKSIIAFTYLTLFRKYKEQKKKQLKEQPIALLRFDSLLERKPMNNWQEKGRLVYLFNQLFAVGSTETNSKKSSILYYTYFLINSKCKSYI